MTLGVAAAAGVPLIVWRKECRHQVEPDPAEMATRYGAEMPALDWRERLICSRSRGRQVNMVLTGTCLRRKWQASGPDRVLPSGSGQHGGSLLRQAGQAQAGD
jgi:hypothetical protein